MELARGRHITGDELPQVAPSFVTRAVRAWQESVRASAITLEMVVYP